LCTHIRRCRKLSVCHVLGWHDAWWIFKYTVLWRHWGVTCSFFPNRQSRYTSPILMTLLSSSVTLIWSNRICSFWFGVLNFHPSFLLFYCRIILCCEWFTRTVILIGRLLGGGNGRSCKSCLCANDGHWISPIRTACRHFCATMLDTAVFYC
jgi:hypothetical protein